MPSIAQSQEENHLRSGASVASSRSWRPLEIGDGGGSHDGSYDDHAESRRMIGGASISSAPPTTMVPSTPEYRHLSRSNDSDDDTVSLLSEPGGLIPHGLFRRRGGRRRGRSGLRYHPLQLSLSQVTAESKACFPVYGCASFLLSMLVAAIFFIPPPADRQTSVNDFALLPCRLQAWQQFGYPFEESDEWTAEQDWAWFLETVDEMDSSDRCRTKADNSLPSYCECNNPTQPWDPDTAAGDDEESIEYTQSWQTEFVQHLARVRNETTLPPMTDMELIMVGDSLTEHFMGTSIGRDRPQYAENAQVFQSMLRNNHEKRPYIHTTPFGISGDRCSQALYRIQNGAVIPTEARLGILTVFWVWIGTNDVIFDSCAPEQVAAGTLAIVSELRQQRPDAWIVVQSLLPSEGAEPSVVNSINVATKCLTDSVKKTFYYNSSNVFMMPSGNGVNASRFVEDLIHPNGEGSRAWARSMLDYLRALYDDRFNL